MRLATKGEDYLLGVCCGPCGALLFVVLGTVPTRPHHHLMVHAVLTRIEFLLCGGHVDIIDHCGLAVDPGPCMVWSAPRGR